MRRASTSRRRSRPPRSRACSRDRCRRSADDSRADPLSIAGLVERLLARVRGRSRDARLLAGERPEQSRQLTARSARLLEPAYRAEVSGAIREMLDAAEHARRLFLKAQ